VILNPVAEYVKIWQAHNVKFYTMSRSG